MHVMIIGAAGMIGRKLTARLASDGKIDGKAITRLTLHDNVSFASAALPVPATIAVSDFAEPSEAAKLIKLRPELIFHLAAIVSGEAETDFDKGYRVNLDGTRYLLEAIRAAGEGYRPRFVFTSSIAVFGAPFPEAIGDDFHCAPLTSYGTQKAICELLLSDYSRRGILNGIGIRLPTISVRPGLPNKAASGFFSGIIREPLSGKEAILPVAEDVRHWHASPRSAIGYLIHAASLDYGRLGALRNFTMPGLSVTVGEQIEALRRAAGDAAVRLIRKEPDPDIARIVAGWPRNFDASSAALLGFAAEERTFDDIIRIYREDEQA